MSAFIGLSCAPALRQPRTAHRWVCVSSPQPPRDPGDLRSESSRRRNQPPKPLRRRRRIRRPDSETLDWSRMDSVPIVRSDSSPPETGEDYWVDLESAAPKRKAPKRGVNESMKERLKQETFAPYKQNWGAWVLLVVGLFALAFRLSGGFDTIPVIPVPDL